MAQAIEEGFMVFVSDGDAGVGSVRRVTPEGLTIWFENAGDRTVPLSAVQDVHFGKVILSCERLEQTLRQAIGHAHDSEDEA